MEISCVICGEPWLACLSDMRPWEAALFRKGSGCPCCEGQSDLTEDQRLDIIGRRLTVEVMECGDLDLVARLGTDEQPPPWERPNDPVLWQCDHCSITSYRDIDDDEPYFRRSFNRHTPRDPDDDPISIDGETRCSDCVSDCDECGETFREESLWGMNHDYDRAYCEDCHGTVQHREHCEWIREECERIASDEDQELNDEFCPGTVWHALDWGPDDSPDEDEIERELRVLGYLPTRYAAGLEGYLYNGDNEGEPFVLLEDLSPADDDTAHVAIGDDRLEVPLACIARIDGEPVDFSEPTPQAQEALPFAS